MYETMKAIVLREFGGPEVLHYEDVSVPRPAAGEVLLKVHSVSVNRTLDLVVRAGKYPVKIQMPHVLGVDPAGEIVEIGEGVDRFEIGFRRKLVRHRDLVCSRRDDKRTASTKWRRRARGRLVLDRYAGAGRSQAQELFFTAGGIERIRMCS